MYYFGATFSEQTAGVFLDQLKLSELYKDILSVPEVCEIAIREKEGQKYLFVLNYSKQPTAFTLHQKVRNLINGELQAGEISLEAYGTRVYAL